jgi:hypothetical protein
MLDFWETTLGKEMLKETEHAILAIQPMCKFNMVFDDGHCLNNDNDKVIIGDPWIMQASVVFCHEDDRYTTDPDGGNMCNPYEPQVEAQTRNLHWWQRGASYVGGVSAI